MSTKARSLGLHFSREYQYRMHVCSGVHCIYICDQVQTTFPFITQPPSTYKKPSEGEINNCNVVTLAVAASVSPLVHSGWSDDVGAHRTDTHSSWYITILLSR